MQKTVPFDNVNIPFETWIILHPLSHDNCFLCGDYLTVNKKTIEHVFPKWLQRDFELENQPLALLNKTWIFYRQIQIPCCKRCNGTFLSQLENDISTGVRAGYDNFMKTVSKLRIFQWLQCLLYKILYKEVKLANDRSNSNSQTILLPYDLASLRLSHLFLRSIDKQVIFKNFFPVSIYIVRTKILPDRQLNFDYIDATPEHCIGIRMNDIGIIGILRDGSLHETLLKPQFLHKILDKTFNPIQFRNLFAKCLYPQTFFNDPFEYHITVSGKDTVEIHAHLKQDERQKGSYVYAPGDPDRYAEILASVIGTEPEKIKLPDGSVGSFFFDTNGNWKDRPFDDDGTIKDEDASS